MWLFDNDELNDEWRMMNVELNLEKQNRMNFKKKEEIQKYSIERDSSYDEAIKNLESTDFGIFIKSNSSLNKCFTHQIYNTRSK